MTKVIKGKFNNLGFLEINDDSFACNTQVRTLEYEWKISYDEYEKIYADDVIFINKRLVKLIDVTVEQWLDLKYGNHMTMDENIKKGVISTWLIRSYKLQFKEYLEIMKQRDTYAYDVDMDYDPSNLVFAKWLASKFYNHLDMDWYTKNALWIYWARGNDEVVLSHKEYLDPGDENIIDEAEVAEIFRIKTNVFDFETPTCRAFKEFNYLLQIDPDVLTKDINRFKTYEEYKDDWIYEWNEDIPWNGHSEWPTCSWKDDGYCNGGNFPRAFKFRNTLRYQDLEWYEALEDGKLKEEAL
ncbi:hypothetical protein Tco_0339772 [Tanacetum coccineum]